MTYAAAKANLLHTGIFLAAKYLRFRLFAPIGGPIASTVSHSTRPTPAIRGDLPRVAVWSQTGVHIPLFQMPQSASVGFHII
jgi:hypothetical protein